MQNVHGTKAYGAEIQLVPERPRLGSAAGEVESKEV